jgi:SAM-dependent methyltransferase/uncharacterized protein YbaR (Trm112 family)
MLRPVRRTTLALLRCPACLSGPLEADEDRPVLDFGPVRCSACGTAWPLAEGVLDLGGDAAPAGSLAARLLSTRTAARGWERGIRGAMLGLAARSRLDVESESVLVRALLGAPAGAPIAELACWTATHARRLAAAPAAGPVIALEAARPMLEEALHQIREEGAAVDLIRSSPEPLPLRDGVLGGAVWIGSLHLVPDPAPVLAEVARALAPGARLVCGTLLPEKLPPLGGLEARAGFHCRTPEQLRELCTAAGLSSFEAVRLPPAIFFRVERPGTAGV